jgi:hypothetical protein
VVDILFRLPFLDQIVATTPARTETQQTNFPRDINNGFSVMGSFSVTVQRVYGGTR